MNVHSISTDPIREQLATVRRNQILDAATKVFAAKGFHRATIKDVARAAAIADGTIYNYFENKTAVLVGILHRVNETSERETHFEQASEMSLREWMRWYIKHRMDAFQPETFEVFRVLLSEMLVNAELREMYMRQVIEPSFEIAKRHFARWVEKGTIGTSDHELAMRAVSGTFLGVIMLRLIGDRPTTSRWNDLPDVMVEILLDGLCKERP